MPGTQPTDGLSILIKHKWKIVLAVIILLITAMFLSIIFRLLDGIIMGIVLAYVARPLKHFIDRYHPRLSPYIATMAIVIPIFLIIGLGIFQAFNMLLWAIKNQDYMMTVLLDFIEKLNLPGFARDRTVNIVSDLTSYLIEIIKQFPVSDVAYSLGLLAINILIAVMLCFYLLVDGGKLVGMIIDIIPDDVEDFSKIFIKHFDDILSALFIGNTYSAIAVGILSMIVFLAFGFANVLALSAFMLLAAIVPILTTWMVIIPLALYRYVEMGSQSAILFIAVYIFVIIIPSDFLIRPYIINARSDIHPMLVIIAFVGGGLVGGIAGFFIAPMLLGAIIAAYRANAELRKESAAA